MPTFGRLLRDAAKATFLGTRLVHSAGRRSALEAKWGTDSVASHQDSELSTLQRRPVGWVNLPEESLVSVSVGPAKMPVGLAGQQVVTSEKMGHVSTKSTYREPMRCAKLGTTGSGNQDSARRA